MAIYTVLLPSSREAESDPMRAVFVKEGFSWPALFFAPLWAIFRRLWIVLAGYIVAVVAIGVIGRVVGDGFTPPALILLHFLFALEANELRRWTLARHGYRLSPGTLYPMLHGMERKGYLTSRVQRQGSVGRKLYKATKLGKQGLALAKLRVREFTGEAMKR